MPTTTNQRAIAIALITAGHTIPQVSELLVIPIRTLQALYSRAKQRAFDPSHRPLEVLDHFIADAPRSGRPRKHPEIIEDNGLTDLKSTLISAMTIVEHLLQNAGLQETKPSQKPWLMPRMRAACLVFAISVVIGKI